MLAQAHRTQGPRPPQAETHLDTVSLGSQASVNRVRANTTIVGMTPLILMPTPFRAPVTARKEAIIIDTDRSNCQQVRYRPLLQLVSEITASRPMGLHH
jgi:hypothetical protein